MIGENFDRARLAVRADADSPEREPIAIFVGTDINGAAIGRDLAEELARWIVVLPGRDWLGFAGIAATSFPAISPEEQFAEKLHAYTLPRQRRENTRVKDLVDLVLLIDQSRLHTDRLRAAIRDTFARRKTHPVPGSLSETPWSWVNVFAELARDCRIDSDLGVQFRKVKEFVGSLLQ